MDGEKVLTLINDWKLHMTCYVKAAEKVSSEIINIISNADDSIYEQIVPEIGLFNHSNIFYIDLVKTQFEIQNMVYEPHENFERDLEAVITDDSDKTESPSHSDKN